MNLFNTTTLILLLNFSSLALAAEFCATNEEELRDALLMASTNNQHDLIKIAQGEYQTAGTRFYYQENQGWDLEISGGWSEFFKNPCGQQSINPFDTALDGGKTSAVLGIRLSGISSLTVSNIAFYDGYTETLRGGGLQVTRADNLAAGNITIENSLFLNNTAIYGSALDMSSADKIHVRNNLFIDNYAIERYAVEIINNNGYGTYFTNNTVVQNHGTADNAAGVYLVAGGSSKLLVANNIIKYNTTEDLRVLGGGEFFLKSNNLGVRTGGMPTEDLNNFSLPSRFGSGSSWRPLSTSPLVNAGVKPCTICPVPLPFDETWSLGDFDFTGGMRVENIEVDIGAGESMHNRDLIFWDRLEN